MSKDNSCQSEFDPNALTVEQALQHILERVEPVAECETVPLQEALSRVLAEDVLSTLNVPAYANSAMDGYAIRACDLDAGIHDYEVIAKVLAGHPYDGEVAAAQCVRIMTGAPVPRGADTVVMQEHVTVEDNKIRLQEGQRGGQNVRQAGEDIAVGDVVLPSGRKLIPADLGLLASLGIAEVKVRRPIRVAFFSTGDELCELGQALGEGQIYDSNRYTVAGMLQRMQAQTIDLGLVRDDPEAIRDAFRQAMEGADMLITSGGVSVGEADYIKDVLAEMGEVGFWKIAMKPGRPLAFGRLDKTWFFGLPGNPVSAMVTFYQFLQPALCRLSGIPHQVPLRLKMTCTTALKKRPGRLDYQRGIMFQDEDGVWKVKTTGNQGSHVLTSMSQANCFIVLDRDSASIEAGSTVEVQPFAALV